MRRVSGKRLSCLDERKSNSFLPSSTAAAQESRTSSGLIGTWCGGCQEAGVLPFHCLGWSAATQGQTSVCAHNCKLEIAYPLHNFLANPSICFPEPFGGCLELWWGIHVGEGAVDAAQGAASSDRRRAAAIPGLFIHGRVVLIPGSGGVPPSPTWRQLYVDFSSNRVAELGAAQLDKFSPWNDWMLLHRSNTNIIHDMQLYRYIYAIYRPYTYRVILLLTPCACCSEALTKLPRILHKCKPASPINQSINRSIIHIHIHPL